MNINKLTSRLQFKPTFTSITHNLFIIGQKVENEINNHRKRI